MRSYPVNENPICSAVSENLRYKQTDRQTDIVLLCIIDITFFVLLYLIPLSIQYYFVCQSVGHETNIFIKVLSCLSFFYFLLTTKHFNDNLLCLFMLCYLCTQSCLFLFIDSIERIKMYKYLRYKTRLNVIIMIIDHVTWKQFLSRGDIGHSNFHSVVGWSVQIICV